MKVSTLLAASVVLVALALLVGSASTIDVNLSEMLHYSDKLWNLSITKVRGVHPSTVQPGCSINSKG